METLSCHSNQSAWATAINNNIFVEANVINKVCKVSASFPLRFLRRRFLNIFFQNLPFMLQWQSIKFKVLDKIHMNCRGLLKKHFCKKKNLNICSKTTKIANFHFSHYKSMETISCHSNQSSYPIGMKTIVFVPPTYRCYVWNIARIGFMASEEMSFENVDDGRTTDASLYYKLTYEPSAQVS